MTQIPTLIRLKLKISKQNTRQTPGVPVRRATELNRIRFWRISCVSDNVLSHRQYSPVTGNIIT